MWYQVMLFNIVGWYSRLSGSCPGDNMDRPRVLTHLWPWNVLCMWEVVEGKGCVGGGVVWDG